MSALARYYHAIGVRVSGYDKTETVLTRKLEDEGMVNSSVPALGPQVSSKTELTPEEKAEKADRKADRLEERAEAVSAD